MLRSRSTRAVRCRSQILLGGMGAYLPLHDVVLRHARGLNITATEVSIVCKLHALLRWLQRVTTLTLTGRSSRERVFGFVLCTCRENFVLMQ